MKTQRRNRYDRKTPVFNIGMVSRLSGIPVWTLRWIERHRLICPARTEGNQRLFCQDDLDLLQEIQELMDQDVNLAGIQVILKMRGDFSGPSPRLPIGMSARSVRTVRTKKPGGKRS